MLLFQAEYHHLLPAKLQPLNKINTARLIYLPGLIQEVSLAESAFANKGAISIFIYSTKLVAGFQAGSTLISPILK